MYGKIIKRGYLYDNSKEIEITYTDSRDAVVALAIGLVEGLLPLYVASAPKRRIIGIDRCQEDNITLKYTGTTILNKYPVDYEDMGNYDDEKAHRPFIVQEIVIRLALGLEIDMTKYRNTVRSKGGDVIFLKPIYDYMEYDIYKDMSEYSNVIEAYKYAMKKGNYDKKFEVVDINKTMWEMINMAKRKNTPYILVKDYTEQFLSEQISDSGLGELLSDGEIESLKSVSKHIISRINTALDMLLG